MINQQLKQNVKSQCEQHDWFYEYGDVFESPIYNEGEESHKKLLATIGNNSELNSIYNKYNPFYEQKQ